MATVNTYHFNVFQLLDAGQGKGMRYLLGELLSTYGLIGNAIIEKITSSERLMLVSDAPPRTR